MTGGGALSGLLGKGGGAALSGLLGKGGGGAAGVLGALTGGGGGGAGGGLANVLGGLLGGAGGGGSPAAGQLLGLLRKPEMIQSLFSMALGGLGRPSVPVGPAQTPVPLGAFANLLGVLANQAAAEMSALADGAEAESLYLMGADGEFRVDPVIGEARAGALLEMLNDAEAARVLSQVVLRPAEDEAAAYARWAAREDEAYDEMEWDESDEAFDPESDEVLDEDIEDYGSGEGLEYDEDYETDEAVVAAWY